MTPLLAHGRYGPISLSTSSTNELSSHLVEIDRRLDQALPARIEREIIGEAVAVDAAVPGSCRFGVIAS